MSRRGETCAIAVMAKAPRAGKVKTRLVPPLTPEAAMALSASFLGDITANIALAAQGGGAPIAGWVAFAPAGTEPLFDGLLAPGTGLVLADGAAAAGEMPPRVEGFGRSLLHAVRALLAMGYGSACVLNSDSPTLPTALLRRTAAALAAPGDRAVLGPAEDGGYYLLGVKAPHARLFEDVAWSTEHVTAQTRERAGELGLEVVTLPAWYDVDDAAALRRLLDDIAAPAGRTRVDGGLPPYPAPVTAACVARLRLADRMGAAGGAAPRHPALPP